MKRTISEKEIEALLTKYKLLNSENEFRRLPIDYEKAAINRVREGRFRDVVFLDPDDYKDRLGSTASTLKRTFEYNTVAAITLFSRAAIEGGVKPEESYDLSDVLLQQLEQATTLDKVYEIFQLSEILFTKIVSLAHRSNKSYQIKQCQIYISKNIFNKITINDLANYVGLNPNYLSQLFTKSEGITLRDYIQREKINVSCNLLEHSNKSISSIALYMGYQSQSKFTQAFKKWKLITPTKYRNQNYNTIYNEGTK